MEQEQALLCVHKGGHRTHVEETICKVVHTKLLLIFSLCCSGDSFQEQCTQFDMALKTQVSLCSLSCHLVACLMAARCGEKGFIPSIKVFFLKNAGACHTKKAVAEPCFRGIIS